jgi:hypothetical protein
MSRQSLRHWVALCLVLPMLVTTPRLRALGQTSQKATIALVRTLADSTATARVIREAGPNGRTLVIMREDSADPATLATALSSLSRSRKKYGDAPKYEFVITLHGHRPLGSLSAEEQQQPSTDYVSRLRKAVPENLIGVGLARTIEVPLLPVRPDGGW